MNIIEGDILNIGKGHIIAHQVNCMKVMGAGIAKKIRDRYPEVYKDYMRHEPFLGTVLYTECYDKTIVASMYGQYNYGRYGVHTRNNAVEKCLKDLARTSKDLHKQIFIPYKIGCNLDGGGGDWDEIYSLIESTLIDCDYTIIKLPEV